MSFARFNILTLSAASLLLLSAATSAQAATPLYNAMPNAAAAAQAATTPAPAPAQTTATTTTSVAPAPTQQVVTTPAMTATPTNAPSAAPSAVTAPVKTTVTTTTPPVTGAAPTTEALQHGKIVGAACPGKWDSAACLSAVSNSNLSLAANFGTALQNKGLNADAEQIKQHCAASTAAREKTFPAYAMKSAFIECANLIADTSAKTGVQPDLSEYQLLVGATMCLDNDVRCKGISDQLQALAGK